MFEVSNEMIQTFLTCLYAADTAGRLQETGLVWQGYLIEAKYGLGGHVHSAELLVAGLGTNLRFLLEK
jgi:hypothetical protein